jgi:hypothetical protein
MNPDDSSPVGSPPLEWTRTMNIRAMLVTCVVLEK